MTFTSAPWPAAVLMSEADLLAAVLDCSGVLGWRSVHFRPARTANGWRTAVTGDGVGFPDLLMVRRHRLVAAELKSARGRLTADQDAWLCALELAGVETHVWRPEDWRSGVIEAVLR